MERNSRGNSNGSATKDYRILSCNILSITCWEHSPPGRSAAYGKRLDQTRKFIRNARIHRIKRVIFPSFRNQDILRKAPQHSRTLRIVFGKERVRVHPFPNRKICNIFPDFHDTRNRFMSKLSTNRHFVAGIRAVMKYRHIGPANAGIDILHQYIVIPYFG